MKADPVVNTDNAQKKPYYHVIIYVAMNGHFVKHYLKCDTIEEIETIKHDIAHADKGGLKYKNLDTRGYTFAINFANYQTMSYRVDSVYIDRLDT